jgi:ketosteroid isomerase-like protein
MIAAVLLASAAGACGGSAAPEPEAPRAAAPGAAVAGDAAGAARAVLEQYRQAHEVRSVEALDPLYLATPGLVRVWQGERTAGWDAARAELAALFNRAQSIKLRVDQVTVQELGDAAAVVVADVSRTVSDGVTSVRVDGVLTLVLRREGERWLIAGEHFSHPPVAP